jgi:hypothetical protein
MTASPTLILKDAHLNSYFNVDIDQREGFRPNGLLSFPIFATEDPSLVLGCFHATSLMPFSETTACILESAMIPIQNAINHAMKNPQPPIVV